jgi:hypothetical protein
VPTLAASQRPGSSQGNGISGALPWAISPWCTWPWLNLLRPQRVRFPWSCQPACTSPAAVATAAIAGFVMSPTSAPAGCRESCGWSRPVRCWSVAAVTPTTTRFAMAAMPSRWKADPGGNVGLSDLIIRRLPLSGATPPACCRAGGPDGSSPPLSLMILVPHQHHQLLAAGDAVAHQVELQHCVVRSEHRDQHGEVFAAPGSCGSCRRRRARGSQVRLWVLGQKRLPHSLA